MINKIRKINASTISIFLSVLFLVILAVWTHNNEMQKLENTSNAFSRQIEGLKGQAFLFNQLAASVLSTNTKQEPPINPELIHSLSYEQFVNSQGAALHNRLQKIFAKNHSWLDASDLFYFKIFDSNTVISNKPIKALHLDKAKIAWIFSKEYCAKFFICTKTITKENLADGFVFSDVHISLLNNKKTISILLPTLVEGDIVAESHIDVNLDHWESLEGMTISSKRNNENLSIIVSNKPYESYFIQTKMMQIDNFVTVTFMRDYAALIGKGLVLFVFLFAFNAMLLLYSREKNKHQKTKLDSMTDSLTGCYNRKIFESLTLERKIAQKPTNTVVVFDGNKIKAINDTYGHDVGDQAIVTIAQAIKRSFRSSDVVVRAGGDEFIVIAFGLKPALAQFIVDEINTKLKTMPLQGNILSVSAGVSLVTHFSDLNNAIKYADGELYENKMYGTRIKRQTATPNLARVPSYN